MAIQDWSGVQEIAPWDWTCGYCNRDVAGNLGYWFDDGQLSHPGPDQIDEDYGRILICPKCNKPTFFEGKKQVPGVAFGAEVDHLPHNVADLYREARNCISVSAFTASALAARKLLMNVAVSQGAKENQKFWYYVDYLVDNGFVPATGKAWVTHIKDKGNEATHEIPAIEPADAKTLLLFMAMLLKMVYEFPASLPGASSP